MNEFTAFLESLKNYINDDVINELTNKYTTVFIESPSDESEMNEYFIDVKNDKSNKTKALKSMLGNGRLTFRPGVGRGSLSYNPEAPMVAAQNANG